MVVSRDALAGADAGGRTTGPCEKPAMLDVHGVAALLVCSARHVYRLADAGRMPRSVKLGALVRWSRVAVLDWIAAGCPKCRTGGSK
ncbi:MAG: hypothetical protein NTV86_10230 [Planctomycetota bacterium]|nr:hypothetical protein [Planctomycetota bacterium]